MDEITNQQLLLFELEVKEESSKPKVKKGRPKRGKKHRSREVFQELFKKCKTYTDKTKLCANEWIKSVCWEDFRKEVLETKQDCCEICESTKTLHLHHIRYDHVTYETYEKDIMVMCASCHFIFEKHRISLEYPNLRETYGIILIKRFFDYNNVVDSLLEIEYLMYRGRIGFSIEVDIDFDHHITVTNVINNFRSSPFSDGGR